RVRELGHRARLAVETIDVRPRRPRPDGRDLQRDLAVERWLVREPDDAGAAVADLAHELELAEAIVRCDRVGGRRVAADDLVAGARPRRRREGRRGSGPGPPPAPRGPGWRGRPARRAAAAGGAGGPARRAPPRPPRAAAGGARSRPQPPLQPPACEQPVAVAGP